MHERPYRPADLFAAGTENRDELFVVVEEPVGVVPSKSVGIAQTAPEHLDLARG